VGLQRPGPRAQIRVREGDRVRVTLKNELPESTVIHFHGLEVPNDQDGVPSSRSRRSSPAPRTPTSSRAARRLAHVPLHHNAANQACSALLGAFIVEPKRPTG
jgi:FtsP/CotA-like multicopper oxidase with cupredoxin domain